MSVIEFPTTEGPTLRERYTHLRENAEAFVTSMQVMVDALKRDGKDDQACDLEVWALNPWKSALRDDDTGDLWLTCEVCSKPIKDDSEATYSDDGCHFHLACVNR